MKRAAVKRTFPQRPGPRYVTAAFRSCARHASTAVIIGPWIASQSRDSTSPEAAASRIRSSFPQSECHSGDLGAPLWAMGLLLRWWRCSRSRVSTRRDIRVSGGQARRSLGGRVASPLGPPGFGLGGARGGREVWPEGAYGGNWRGTAYRYPLGFFSEICSQSGSLSALRSSTCFGRVNV